MMTPYLIENILKRVASALGLTQAELQEYQKKQMAELNQRLNDQMEVQVMTPDVLNKRCTL